MTNFNSTEINEYFSIARKAIIKAGIYLKGNFNKTHVTRPKKNLEITIKEDTESEKLILDLLLKNFPDHKIYSEEAGNLGNRKSEYLWLIDPLDGTTNYSLNIPLFCIQLALFKNKNPLFSFIYLPMLENLLWAIKNHGIFINQKRVFVNNQNDLGKSRLCLDKGSTIACLRWYKKIIPLIADKVRTLRIFSCAGFDFSLLASGRIEGYLNYGSKTVDYAPGALALQEAGGRVTDNFGKPWTLNSRYLIASNGKIHDKLLRCLEDNTCEVITP